MKIVVDTNLFVASHFNKRSASARILKMAKENKLQILWTEEIRSEVEHILKNVKAKKLLKNLSNVLKKENQVFPRINIKEIKEDPQDNKFLECAFTGEADMIITSDSDLLSLKDFQGISILIPKNALKLIKK